MTATSSELAFLFRTLKAPAAARALPKLAERARAEEWSYEQFAQTLLATEVASRDAHGGESRIKQARFPARKTLEEFDFSFQRSVQKTLVLHLGQLDFLTARDNVVLLGPPGTGKTIWRSRSGSALASRASGSPSPPPPSGSPASATRNGKAASMKSCASCSGRRS
jgi:DNA replication protein DnaC